MKTIEEFLKNLVESNNLTLDLEEVLNYYDGNDFSEFEDNVNTYIHEHSDVIYYAVAIDFLKEHDPSLNESMSLAADLGYDPESINSELLASLLNAQKMREEWSEVSDEIEEYFEEYQDYLYEQEDEE